jgi:hypothetical protein
VAGALLLDNARTNTAVSVGALLSNSIGQDDNAFGTFALLNITTGFFKNTRGCNAILDDTTGTQNNTMGDDAMFSNNTGSFNTAMGDDALDGCIDGNSNIAIGNKAGTNIVHGSNIIMTGVSAVSSAFGDADNTCYINHIFGQPVGAPVGAPGCVWRPGSRAGFLSSPRKFKYDIEPMDKASEAIFALKAVAFEYNSNKTNTPQYSLIAEDVLCS